MPGRPLHFNRALVADVDALARKYETKEFNSPFRSTLPLLAMLKDAGSKWHYEPGKDSLIQALNIRANAARDHLLSRTF